MKAVRLNGFGGTENLSFEEIERPKPKDDEVLVKTAVAGINFADIMLRQDKYLFTPDLPFTPGFEAAGTVESVGRDVSHLKEGQRVLAMMRGGGYAEYTTAPAAQVFPIPGDMEFGESTALLVQGMTALGLLVNLKRGQTILIHAAAGGVGSLLVQLAKHKGARVLGTASSSGKLEKIAALGADVGIDYTESDWVEQVVESTGGKGADLIIEMVGGDIGRKNLDCLAVKGTMIVYGAASGEDFEISAFGLLGKMQTVQGYNLNLETPENIAKFSSELAEYHKTGELTIMVREFDLKDAAAAHEAIESRTTIGKVVLRVD